MRSNIIVRRDPFQEFDALVRRSFGPHAFGSSAWRGGDFLPAAESHRDGDDAVVRIEIPGVDAAKDVNVEVVGRRLVISGERRDERDESDANGGQRLREFRYGSFRREFGLGAQVKPEDVSASYDAGVLTVRVKGAYSETKGQRIAVSTGAPAAGNDEPAKDGEA